MLCRLAFLLLTLVGCTSTSNATPATSSESQTPRPEQTSLRAFPKPWDPSAPIDLDELRLRRLFVVADNSALCPTREQAQARRCGNAEEFAGYGLRLHRGDSVRVVGDAPFDGHWRAIRFQLDGPLPSWIRADDLAPEPTRINHSMLEARDDFSEATAIDTLAPEAIHLLEPGTLVKFTRRTNVTLSGFGSVGEVDNELFLYVPAEDGAIAVSVLEDEDAP